MLFKEEILLSLWSLIITIIEGSMVLSMRRVEVVFDLLWRCLAVEGSVMLCVG